ncbi:MAG TPA: hypothetical protein VFD84_03340 [Candidatus Binatia bacterium]|jgi:hypothetical protein|nr:hypothetical protein [Candidatus Binatia bacterium]
MLAVMSLLASTALPGGAFGAGGPSSIEVVGGAAEARRFVAYYHTIPLTPEQERTKAAALESLKAPCCAQVSLATCCCPCNLAKAAWASPTI